MIFLLIWKNNHNIKNKLIINLEMKLVSIFFQNIRKLIKDYEYIDYNNFS